jgi:hypothetical protein
MNEYTKGYVKNHYQQGELKSLSVSVTMWCISKGYIEPVVDAAWDTHLEFTELGKIWLGLYDVQETPKAHSDTETDTLRQQLETSEARVAELENAIHEAWKYLRITGIHGIDDVIHKLSKYAPD